LNVHDVNIYLLKNQIKWCKHIFWF